ncbi:Cro/CI family transcriptional regulator [Labrys neptuniae]
MSSEIHSHVEPLKAAIQQFGSEAKLAAAVGVSQTAINKAKRAYRVSAELAVAIETATKGKIKRQQLRPDLWPEKRRSAA